MDAIHYKVRDEGRIVSKAAYIVLGVTTEGYKDILSITVGANESSKFWLGMLNDLKNRGVQDVLFFCVDGLPGFRMPSRLCSRADPAVHHPYLRNSFKYVNYSDLKKFASDFKAVYNASTEEMGKLELETLKGTWGKKYPMPYDWEDNWEELSSFYQFSGELRKIMYTTNIIEGKPPVPESNKEQSVFPNDASLAKMLYLASQNVMKKWTQRYRGWDQVIGQLILLYGERLTQYL